MKRKPYCATSILCDLNLFTVYLVVVAFAGFLKFNEAKAEELRWNNTGKSYETLAKVTFVNGSEITYLDRPSDFSSGRKIVYKGGGEKTSKIILEDDHVYIDWSYPNSKSAIIAFISNSCGGNASFCAERKTYMVIQDNKKGLMQYLVGNAPFEFMANFASSNIISAIAKNIVNGTDAYGSGVQVSLQFIANKGFVDRRAKQYYVSLINAYAFDFFDNKIAREFLAKLVGLAKFRDLRESMAVATPSRVVGSRYLVFTGCMAHACPDSFGGVVIDTTNDDVWWIHVKDEKFMSGGSRKFGSFEIPQLRDVLGPINFNDMYSLGVDDAGNLTLLKKMLR